MIEGKVAVIVALALSVLFGPLAAEAQRSERVYRIGLLDYSAPDAARQDQWWNAFRQQMREFGYEEGQNVSFEPRWAHGDTDRLPKLAAELVGLKVDVIVTAGTNATIAAKRATSTIPIVTTTAAARTLGLTLKSVSVRTPADLETAFSTLVRERAAALSITNSPMFFPHRKRLAELAMKYRLPTVVSERVWVEAGLLAAYGPDYPNLFRRAATFVNKILKGAKPGDLPIEQPTRFELSINLKTAKALGLTIPSSVLQQADHVIQ